MKITFRPQEKPLQKKRLLFLVSKEGFKNSTHFNPATLAKSVQNSSASAKYRVLYIISTGGCVLKNLYLYKPLVLILKTFYFLKGWNKGILKGVSIYLILKFPLFEKNVENHKSEIKRRNFKCLNCAQYRWIVENSRNNFHRRISASNDDFDNMTSYFLRLTFPFLRSERSLTRSLICFTSNWRSEHLSSKFSLSPSKNDNLNKQILTNILAPY